MKAVQTGESLKIFKITIAFSLYFEYYDGASIVYKKEELHKGFPNPRHILCTNKANRLWRYVPFLRRNR